MDKTRTSLWERLERPAPPPRPTLSAQDIAAVAVRLADREGLDAITMRRLATELGVAPMAAYRHVTSKVEVLELMIDRVYGELEPIQPTGWRETLRAIALSIRGMILNHPWLVHITSPQVSIALTPNRMAVAERALSALDGTGLDSDTMMSIYRSVDAYVLGAAQAEIGLQELMRDKGWSTGDDLRAALGPEMTWLLGTGRYPMYERYIRRGVRKDDRQWQFESGLDCLLDGVAGVLEPIAKASKARNARKPVRATAR